MIKYLLKWKQNFKGSDTIKEEFNKILKEFKKGTKNMFKELFDKRTAKNQIANVLSFFRLVSPLIIVPIASIGSVFNIPILLSSAGIITIFSGVTDLLDGAIAKKLKITSEYGKVLDQITDKVFATLISISLIFINPTFIVPILGEIIIGCVNLYYKFNYKNLEHKSTQLGRIKEWPLFGLLGIGYFCPINSICLFIANILIPTVFTLQLIVAGSYISENSKEIKNMKLKENNDDNIIIEDDDQLGKKNIKRKETKVDLTKNNSKIEEYIRLRNILTEVIYIKSQESTNTESNSIQKIKR